VVTPAAPDADAPTTPLDSVQQKTGVCGVQWAGSVSKSGAAQWGTAGDSLIRFSPNSNLKG
jgi:hypothetical protein